LQRDAGKLIQKFEELNKEHEELEKLKRYADTHFSGIANHDSFVGIPAVAGALPASFKINRPPSQSG
jgi:hypothetical protein